MHVITEPSAEETEATSQTEITKPRTSSTAARHLIPVADLTSHPGNVRDNLDLTDEFRASIAAEGVRIPLLITTSPDGGWRVIEGHRRLKAAMAAGLTEVPCDVDSARADDEAGQYLDMLLANGDSYRSNFRPAEEAAALFAAHEAGASRTRLRKATGRSATQIKVALEAGRLPAETRTRATASGNEVTLDQLALLAEFDGDEDATSQLLQSLELDYPLEHIAQRIRHDRAEASQHARLRTDLEAAGIAITDELPPGAEWLASLTHDGDDLTPEVHSSCPGRGATFSTWSLLEPSYYCTSPLEHGHLSRWAEPAGEASESDIQSESGTTPDPAPGSDRRLVITGNKAWDAAAAVRHRWIADTLLSRRSASREVHAFIARQLLTMPGPVRSGLTSAHVKPLFARFTGDRDSGKLDHECGTATVGRLATLTLAPIVTAYEHAMTEADGRNTWRTDRYSPCPRSDAAAYLAFLASLGYELSEIERAVANDTPFTGTTPLIAVLADEDDQTAA